MIYENFNKKIYNFERVETKLPPNLVLYNIYIPSIFFKIPSKIELDFLLHKPNYKLQETQISTFLYESNCKVKTPTVNALLGDKLTVLGPNTIGKTLDKNPLNFGKQLYDISILLEYFENFDEVFDAYYDIFNFEKVNRNLPSLEFKNSINDLVNICKLFALIVHRPDGLNDKDIISNIQFLKRGISNLVTYTSSKLKLNPLKGRTISAKIAFLAKLMLLKYNKSLTETIPIGIFQHSNKILTELIQDSSIVNEIIYKLSHLEYRERYHIVFREIKKTDPLALFFWYGYYFPDDFLQFYKE